MIISVIGTQCIGKSTFIKDFITTCPKFTIPEIDYRNVIEKNNLKLNRQGDHRSQQFLFDFMKDQVLELAKDQDKFYIVDRSLVDVVAYSMWLYDNRPEVFTEDQICEMIVDMQKYVNVYKYLIYIPLAMCNDVIVEDDKFRDTNVEYRKNIDSNFKYILDTYYTDLPPIIEVFGNRTERIEMLQKNCPNIF